MKRREHRAGALSPIQPLQNLGYALGADPQKRKNSTIKKINKN